MTFCDCCGDLVTAYIPVQVEFYKRGSLTLNVCLGCWNYHIEGKSRKVKVAKLLQILMET